jgi:O-antigen/teichoic acid export membrane protein
MSLKRNIIANYASQTYTLVIGIILIPIYIDMLGVEAYGLIGFYITLQAWYMLLDLGLSPTVSREVAIYQSGALSNVDLCHLIRSIEIFFVAVAIAGATIFIYQRDLIAKVWLKSNEISSSDIASVLLLMGLVMASRWLSGVYRAIVYGFEKIIWLGGASIFIATLRFVFVIPVLSFFGSSPIVFFYHQLLVALLELLILLIKAYKLLPAQILTSAIRWDFLQIRRIYKFALTIAFTSFVWVVTTQLDKLLISGMIPLKEFGQFVLATSLASGIIFVLTPISSALMPRLARLSSEGRENELVETYRNATQITAIILAPIVFTMSFHAETILWIWTGNSDIAKNVSTVLSLYSLGNGLLVLAAFPYFIQYAKGDLKLHLRWNAFFLIAYLPVLISAITYHGAIGAAWTWLVANFIALFFWVPFAHRRLLPGLQQKWMLIDTLPIIAGVFLVGWLPKHLFQPSESQPWLIATIGSILIISYLTAAVASSYVRSILKSIIHKK